MRLNAIFGLKKVLSLGTLVLAVYYLLLNQLGNGSIHFLLVALTFGISVALYYSAFHIEFSKVSDKKKEATEYAIIQILTKGAAALGPLVGAIFISKVSFGFLFSIVSGLLILSVIPLFLTKDQKIDMPKISLRKILYGDSRIKAICYQANGVLNITSGVFWPLFIFLTLKTIVSLGIIVSLTSLITLFFIFLIGKLSDKHKRRMLKLGIVTHAFSWISRLFFLSPIGVFFNNLYGSLSLLAIDIPFSKFLYEGSKKSKDIADYFLFRSLNLGVGRAIVLLIAFFSGSLYWTFILSFFATFGYSVLLKKQH